MLAAGQKLEILRIQKDLTQREVSLRTGIAQANLSRIEKGKQDPTVSTFLKICRALEVHPSEVLEEKPPESGLILSRSSLERIAKGFFDPSLKLPPLEREISELLKILMPDLQRRRRRLSSKKIYSAWYQLKKRTSNELIRTLMEKVQDERSRQKAKAEKDYQELVVKMRQLWGKA